MGWSIEGTINPKVKHAVIIVVPHTSSFDFILGLLIRSILGLHINYLGKKELFIWPFKYYFRWTGGRPLDRTGGQNKVAAIAQLFRGEKVFRLALSPEGTRKKVKDWRTGFYYIAMEANVPVLPIACFTVKNVSVLVRLWLSQEKLMRICQKSNHFLKAQTGKYLSIHGSMKTSLLFHP